MRAVRFAIAIFLTACGTSPAWAQYGLYGSPDTLSLPPPQQASAPSAAPTNYPTTATPTTQPVPASYPAQPPAYYYPAQPPYRYPTQPPAMYQPYQPYQPAAQYQYPPYPTRPPVRTAAIEPMAVPATPSPTPAPTPAPMPMPAAPVPAGSPTTPALQSSGMMNQMLAEQGGTGGYGANCGAGGVYRGAVGQYEQAACRPGAEGCGHDGSCGQGYYCCPWYAYTSVLALGRTDARRVWTSYLDGHPETQLSNTQFGMPWQWGGEVRLGHRCCCGCTPYALEGTFWSTMPTTVSQTTNVLPNYVSTPLQTDNISFAITGSPTATFIFSGAQSQTVSRWDEYFNFEINLIREQLAWACDSPWDIGWSMGVRYFRFQESLAFSSLSHDADYDAYFKNAVTDNLLGIQFGFDAAYNVANCVRLFITPKVGIYGNFFDSTFDAKARYGSGAYVDGHVDVPGYPSFPAHGTDTGIAFLTQIDVGADWQFTRNWSARVGYRVVAITGMALADDQFPQYMCDTLEMQNPQHYSSLVLHGAFLGATYCF